MMGLCSKLARGREIIDEDELFWYTLNGINFSYNALVALVNVVPGTTLDDLFGQLSSYDMRQKMLDET
jgi:hypothetical protein